MQQIETLKKELTFMPDFQLRKSAIKDYDLIYKEIRNLPKEQLIDRMISVEFRNCYK